MRDLLNTIGFAIGYAWDFGKLGIIFTILAFFLGLLLGWLISN